MGNSIVTPLLCYRTGMYIVNTERVICMHCGIINISGRYYPLTDTLHFDDGKNYIQQDYALPPMQKVVLQKFGNHVWTPQGNEFFRRFPTTIAVAQTTAHGKLLVLYSTGEPTLRWATYSRAGVEHLGEATLVIPGLATSYASVVASKLFPDLLAEVVAQHKGTSEGLIRTVLFRDLVNHGVDPAITRYAAKGNCSMEDLQRYDRVDYHDLMGSCPSDVCDDIRGAYNRLISWWETYQAHCTMDWQYVTDHSAYHAVRGDLP